MQAAAIAAARRRGKDTNSPARGFSFRINKQQQQQPQSPQSQQSPTKQLQLTSPTSQQSSTPAVGGASSTAALPSLSPHVSSSLTPPSIHEDEIFHDSREALKKKRRLPHMFPKWARRPCGILVNDVRFQTFVVFLIIMNSIMMGIATYSIVEDNPNVAQAFATVDLAFLILFTAELLLQIVHKDVRIFLSGWLVFDFVVVLFSWSFATVKVMRAFRIFRAFRLIGRIKVLRVLVDALLGVIPRLASIGLLLLLLFYIFAVMFTQLFMFAYADGITSDDYFGRLDVSLFTLFQMMCMDGWADIAREVMATYSWAWAPFVVFVVLSGFVVVNLIIAVICDAIFILHDLEEASAEEEDFGVEDVEVDDDDDDERKDGVDAEKGKEELERKRTMEEEVRYLTEQVDQMLLAQQQVLSSFEQMVGQLRLGREELQFDYAPLQACAVELS